MFRIIGLETLSYPENLYELSDDMSNEQKIDMDIRKARYHSVMKILRPNQTYWFYDGYEKDENGKCFRTSKATPYDFFQCGNTNISISSIVAENGMGKSSLLELYFRIINNVAYALREGIPAHKNHLCFVRDIFARIIIEIDGNFSTIEQRDSQVIYQDQTKPESNWLFDFDVPKIEPHNEAKEKLKRLFYTIVINYSHYAYNVNDYVAEWNDTNYDVNGTYEDTCWIASLFRKKND